MKLHNVLLACVLGAGSLLGAAAPASAARVAVGTARPAATGRVFPGNPHHGTGYRSYGYRYGAGYPYRYGYGYRYGAAYPYRYGYGYPYGYGVGLGVGYGYIGGGSGYAPYPAVYGHRPYWARRRYWSPYRRAY
jgi:hypothetical protein